MGRNCIRRHVQGTPAVKGFRPFGRIVGNHPGIVLTLDEYEAIRLLDYTHLTQESAAERMQVSRPTLTRIYEKARVKFATALVEGRLLLIGGGDVCLQSHLYHCNSCHTQIQTQKAGIENCPHCNSHELASLDECQLNNCRKCRKCGSLSN